jgi:crossover junction endodeoxyribonuclease RusA
MIATVLLPWPASELSPNSRNQWAKIKAVKEARALAAQTLLGETVFIPAKIPAALKITMRFYPPTRRHFDIDGLVSRCKAYQDGLFECLGLDDNLITALEARRCDVIKNGAVEIEIKEDCGDAHS